VGCLPPLNSSLTSTPPTTFSSCLTSHCVSHTPSLALTAAARSLPLTAAMAEWAGPKGKASTKPRHPSRLQNEVNQDAADDEYVDGHTHVRVPDSDRFIPETQFRHVEDDADNFGDDLPHDAGGSDLCNMSPNSLALLNRTRFVKKYEPSGTAVNLGSLLSRPIQHTPSPPLQPHWLPAPSRKAPTTRALKPELVAAATPAESNVSSTAPEPKELTRERKCHLSLVVHLRPS
jgi:hypothetical protein